MNCPRCANSVETGAAFCGNCGQVLTGAQQTAPEQSAPTNPAAPPQFVPAPNVALPGPQTQGNIPSYAVTPPAQQAHDTKALISVILGTLGLPFCIIPILGFVMGIAGLVLGTLSRKGTKKTLSTIGIVVSCLAIVSALGMWAYSLDKQISKNDEVEQNSNSVATSVISTKCYTITFTKTMNTDRNEKDGCDTRAYDAASIEISNDVYKVYANKVNNVTESNFAEIAKTALEKDVAATLPGFEIKDQNSGIFAGSPAYFVYATDGQIAVVEAAVFRKVATGDNVFSLVHAERGTLTDLKKLETNWQWK